MVTAMEWAEGSVSPRWQGCVAFQGLRALINDSGPPFSELFFSGSFHLPARPTSPFDFCDRQTFIRKRFVLIVRCAKADGTSRTGVHLEHPICFNLVVQVQPMVVVFAIEPN